MLNATNTKKGPGRHGLRGPVNPPGTKSARGFCGGQFPLTEDVPPIEIKSRFWGGELTRLIKRRSQREAA